MKLVSVVVPIYLEEALVDELHSRLSAALESLGSGYAHELIYVNDGSTDGSLARLLAIAEKDPTVGIVDLSRNFGHQLAITAGIDAARGDAVVVIDGDLQDPPEVIGQMVAKWQEGYEVVYGQRSSRAGESGFKRASAKAFYRLLNRLSDYDLPLDTGDFRLMDRKVVEALKRMREESRYLRGMVTWVGFRQYALPYDRAERTAGRTKYSLSKMVQLAVSGVTSFSTRPLRIAVNFGALVTVLAAIGLVWVVVLRILNLAETTRGWASVTVMILFMGGVQLMSIGVLGEYLGRVFMESKGRPLYIVAHRYGAASDSPGCPTCGRPLEPPTEGGRR